MTVVEASTDPFRCGPKCTQMTDPYRTFGFRKHMNETVDVFDTIVAYQMAGSLGLPAAVAVALSQVNATQSTS